MLCFPSTPAPAAQCIAGVLIAHYCVAYSFPTCCILLKLNAAWYHASVLQITDQQSVLSVIAPPRILQVLQRCGMRHVPPVGDVQEYLSQGPGFVFLFHPSLGPLWDVISQKIRGGALLDGSELVLEVAEARLLDVTVDGSLLVYADNVMGHMEVTQQQQQQQQGAGDNGSSSSSRLQYSAANGRVHLMNVTVQNVGVDWHHPGNVYWQHRVNRHEACKVVLHGRSEFEAYDCRITGNQVGILTCYVIMLHVYETVNLQCCEFECSLWLDA
jgi:hypothetical protein